MSRIALLPSAYPPSLGGVQELSRHLALALTDAGDQVEVWWQQDDGRADSTVETLDGLTIRRFPFPLPRAHPSSWAAFAQGSQRSIRELRRAAKAFRPDVLHVQCFGPNGAYATLLSRLVRIPLVLTLQGETVMDDQDIFEHSKSLRGALRAGLRQASVVTACSGFTLADAEDRFGLRAGKGHVIFNGVVVDPDDADPPISDVVLPSALSGRYVIALGRVVEKKGFDLLLEAFARIAGRHPDVVLAIGGDGPFLPVLTAKAEALEITDRVRFVGRLTRTQVAGAMTGAEVFVMPSRLEPFGIVVLEGWRSGRPVIATSRGGPPEFVHDGNDGLLVDPFDTAALADALDRLLSDRALGDTIGAEGRRQVERFSWTAIAERYQALYRVAAPFAPTG